MKVLEVNSFTGHTKLRGCYGEMYRYFWIDPATDETYSFILKPEGGHYLLYHRGQVLLTTSNTKEVDDYVTDYIIKLGGRCFIKQW